MGKTKCNISILLSFLIILTLLNITIVSSVFAADVDGDGFVDGPDCNDLDPTINPAQCDIKKDGIDQDCDGFDRTKGKPCAADDGGGEDPVFVEGPGQTCNDGLDNDDDGLIDCADDGCGKKKHCKKGNYTCDSDHLELCTNSIDCTNAGGYWWNDNTCNSTIKNGKLITSIHSGAQGRSIELQDDGKIVVFGQTRVTDISSFLLIRYNSDGSQDTTFGNGGWITTSAGYNDSAQGMSIQLDGKILATGFTDSGTNMALLRYNSDGSIDEYFGVNGLIKTKNTTIIDQGGNTTNFIGTDVTYQEDGKVLVIGTTMWSWSSYYWHDVTLVRYTYDGVLDTTFDNDGFMNTNILGNATGSAITVTPDGKIIAVGGSGTTSGSTRNPPDFALVKINEDGSLDNSFYNGGIVTTAIGSGIESGVGTALQVDGKIVVAGDTNNGSDKDFALVRYSSDGGLDGGFGNNGIVTLDINSGSEDHLYGVALQADGKILMVGTSGGDVVLVRYYTDGTLDESFGVYGFVTTDIFDENDKAYGVAVQEDGKILVVGSCTEGIALLRYNSDGTLDNSFGEDITN